MCPYLDSDGSSLLFLLDLPEDPPGSLLLNLGKKGNRLWTSSTGEAAIIPREGGSVGNGAVTRQLERDATGDDSGVKCRRLTEGDFGALGSETGASPLLFPKLNMLKPLKLLLLFFFFITGVCEEGSRLPAPPPAGDLSILKCKK